jgi:hypothetical protein
VNGRRFLNWLEPGSTPPSTIAAAAKINASSVSQILRLTLLAPNTVEAILEGWQPTEMTLAALMKVFPLQWKSQSSFGFSRGPLSLDRFAPELFSASSSTNNRF